MSRGAERTGSKQRWLVALSRPSVSPPTRTFGKCRIKETPRNAMPCAQNAPSMQQIITARDIYGYHRAHSKDLSRGSRDDSHSAVFDSTAGDFERAIPALP
jgi:hypothetical protein